MIEIQNLTKCFDEFKALDNLNINVKKGSVYGLVGPNGAGKTTLIKLITGIYRQNSGTVTINGEGVYENLDIKSKIVYIADDPFFFSQYSIQETAKYFSAQYPTWSWERYEKLKKVFPIDTKRRVVKLSKGMQKQVAFWMAISIMPEIMILDEPVDGLDPVMRKKVWNLVLQDVAERNTTVLVSSHNLRELEDVCDHVGILHSGKIVVERDLEDMKSDVHKLQLAFDGDMPQGLLKDINVLHSSQKGSLVLLIVKGNIQELTMAIRKLSPIIFDILPLTLEEIFIYELEGIGYDIENIII